MFTDNLKEEHVHAILILQDLQDKEHKILSKDADS